MRLEDRIRATLHAEAERFEPQLASSDLRPAAPRRSWVTLAGAAAAVVVVVGTGVLLTRPVPPADTVPPPVTTEPQAPSTTADTRGTLPTLPDQLAPWVPEFSVEDGVASLVIEFIDGSTAEVRWPESLDLVSGGVYPYGYAVIPNVAARDFFIRRGNVEDLVNQFGPATVLSEYPDGQGGTVALWHPEEAGVDFLGFQFGDWIVLVYEGGSEVLTPPMSDANRRVWAESFRGETTPDGFLRLYADEPLRIAGDKLSMTFQSPQGSVELHLEGCLPRDPGEFSGGFVSWCDAGGQIEVHVTGPEEFARAVHEGLQIGSVHMAGISGPDANGSFGYLTEELQRNALTWATALELAKLRAGSEPAYRLRITGHAGFAAIDYSVLVEDGIARWEGPPPRTGPIPTVEYYFQIIEDAIESGHHVSARFHPDGYVSWLATDDPGFIDDETMLSIQLEWLD